MKDFKAHFEAVHAATEGDMKPAEKLFKPKGLEGKPAPKSAPSPENWVAEHERKQEEDGERLRKSREEAESGRKA